VEEPESWGAVASGWERRRAFVWENSRVVGERLVDLLDPKPGESILELAAGTGDTGFLAAERLGRQGRLLSTDIAPEMVEAARRRASEVGATNVDFALADAQALDLADGTIDGVLCRWGYMLIPEPARALAETHRVLKPGGRVALAVWAESERNPWGTAAGRALVTLGLMDRPDPDAPGPFRLGAKELLVSLVRDAELEVAHSAEVTVSWRSASFDEWWEVQSDLSRMLATALAELAPSEVERVRQATQKSLERYANAEGALAIPGVCRVVLGRRPQDETSARSA
jgi:SAM-dependent methyltransferase